MDEDYPRTLLEQEQRFGNVEACAECLATLRWPDGWACPRDARRARFGRYGVVGGFAVGPVLDVDHGWNHLSGQAVHRKMQHWREFVSDRASAIHLMMQGE